ncbi:hypothetical protein LJC49_05155 [Ruminococcaceae bacterium OttesenSCG-928-I18]|nr:hypothetical protein [Ruminococcaceae bacterium OttesenSCG-928-I18]
MKIVRQETVTRMRKEFYEWLLGRLVKPDEMAALDLYFSQRFLPKEPPPTLAEISD